ncbi:MAG: immune inhibitor A, partial [Planctomycetota bacterium]|nr:immune inhibitor A [Planctomycetota bacterium]
RGAEVTFTLQSGVGGVYGTKFDDLNGNGQRDEGEPGLENWLIYADLNLNGQRDFGEPYTLTDSNGDYGLVGLDLGYYAVAEEPQGYAIPTVPHPDAAIGNVVVLDANFEESGDGFVIDNTGATVPGLWHRSTRRGADAGHSPSHSFYFGRDAEGNYDVGDTAGRITSAGINLATASSATLTFAYFLNVETPTTWDRAEVEVSTDGSIWTRVASRLTGAWQTLLNDSAWHTCSVNLSAYLGQTIQVRFVFDTVDEGENAYEGWFVDDVRVTANLQAAGALGVLLDDGYMAVQGIDFGNRQVIDAGPDQMAVEGEPVDVSAWVADLQIAHLVKDIAPGLLHSDPSDFAIYDGDLYFAANDSANGRELWMYDGKKVQMVADLMPGSDSSVPTGLTVFGNRLYFAADNGTAGRELFAFDGKGIQLVQDIYSGATGSDPASLFVWQNKLYFSAATSKWGRELMVFDGVKVGLVADIWVGGDSDPSDFADYAGQLYFAATGAELGRELYRYNGTSVSGVADINPGGTSSSPTDLVVFSNVLYFAATNATAGRELF